MPYDTLPARVREAADAAQRFLQERHGGRVEVDTPIHDRIEWRPTFLIRADSHIIAVEADEILVPPILKLSGLELLAHYELVAVHVATPVEVLLADKNMANVRELRRNGFGLITVNDD